MDIGIIESVASLGVGAVFGLIVFCTYRLDRRSSEKRLTYLLQQDQETRRKHTEALTELILLVRNINGRLK